QLTRSHPDVALQCARQVRLVRVARAPHGVMKWRTALNELSGALRALDLADRAAAQPGRAERLSLRGAFRRLAVALANQQSAMRQLLDERFGVLEPWELPGRRIEPER